MNLVLTEEELHVLRGILKTELMELPDLMKSLNKKDKDEMEAYEGKVESIYNKIK